MATPDSEFINDLAGVYGVSAHHLKEYYEALEAPAPEAGGLTDSEIREVAAKFGVSYEHLRSYYVEQGAIAPLGETTPG